MCRSFVSLTLDLFLLPPTGPSGSLLCPRRSQEEILQRLQEANGGKLGAALRRSDQFNLQPNQFDYNWSDCVCVAVCELHVHTDCAIFSCADCRMTHQDASFEQVCVCVCVDHRCLLSKMLQ